MSAKGIIFLAFAVILALVLVAQQVVKNMHVQRAAEDYATQLFTWDWPDNNWQSQAQIIESNVVSRTDKDAVVKVRGSQILTTYKPGVNPVDITSKRSETVDCTATLTFYKHNDHWELGKVELE